MLQGVALALPMAVWAAICAFLDAPVVVTVHSDIVKTGMAGVMAFWYRKLQARLINRSADRITLVFTSNKYEESTIDFPRSEAARRSLISLDLPSSVRRQPHPVTTVWINFQENIFALLVDTGRTRA